MKKEVPIFTDYNIIRKLLILIVFAVGFIFQFFMLVSQHDLVPILFCFLLELMCLLIEIYIATWHVSLYTDRIETGSIFSKETILFKAIKELDIRLVEESCKGKKYEVLYAIFLGYRGQELLKIPVNSRSLATTKIFDIISVAENCNDKIKRSDNLIEYLKENTNYKKK